MPDAAPKSCYTREEVRRLLAVTERQLKGWERHDLIPQSDTFAFSDLVTLRTIIRLRENHVPSARIRDAVTALRSKMREIKDPLKEMRIVAERGRIRVDIGGQKMEPVSGQLLLNFDKSELKQLVSFPDKKSGEEERTRRASAENHFQRGLELEQTGAVQEAIRAYETAIQLDPGSAGALVNLGTIYFNARLWGKAETYYKRALEAEPEYPLAHFNMANLCDEKGDTKRAVKHYARAVELNPKYADAHYNLALLHQGAGHVMDAVRHWKLYLKLDAGSSWSAIARRELDKLRKSTLVHGAGRGKPESGTA